MGNGAEVKDSRISQGSTRAPGWIEQPAAGATRAAEGMFNGSIPESYTTSQGRDVLGQTLRGDFMLPGSNPFLQGTFDRGADAIQQRMDSQFSGGGRNLGASKPGVQEDLSSFANQLFGGNYQAERGRQDNALNQVSQFDPINQFIQRLGPLANIAGKETQSSVYGNTEERGSGFDMFTQALDAVIPG
jgi:hypothetical protein